MSSRPGFPVDDDKSIQCDDGGSADLSIFYNHQYVHNEVVPDDPGQTLVCVHKLSKTNLLPGTVSGMISANTWELEFAARWNAFSSGLNDLIFHDPKVSGTVDCEKGEITLYFKSPPGRHGLIVCYEFSVDSAEAECICTIVTLMAQGCCCGHLKKHA